MYLIFRLYIKSYSTYEFTFNMHGLLFVKDNLQVLQSFEKTCTAYKPNIDELEDINQVKYYK